MLLTFVLNYSLDRFWKIRTASETGMRLFTGSEGGQVEGGGVTVRRLS